MSDFQDLTARLKAFTEERSWEGYHSAQNLALALAGEVGEVCQLLRWTSVDGVTPLIQAQLQDELSDVAIFLLLLAAECGVELSSAVKQKIDSNESRYPPTPRARD